VTAKHLAPRVLSFNEINLDFFLYNDNVFHMSRKNVLYSLKRDSKVDMPDIQKILEELSRRLFTVCSVFLEHPHI